MRDAAALHALAELARHSIHSALALPGAALPDTRAFAAHGAAFVTLTRASRLRGCIGTLEAWRSLAEDVVANARAAALDDPRFPALTLAEIDDTVIEVSVLEPATPLVFADEADLLRRLRPGRDGLTLRYRERRATFLPSVWTQLSEPAQFLEELRRKAGIPVDVAVDQIAVERYTTLSSPRLPLAWPVAPRDTSRQRG